MKIQRLNLLKITFDDNDTIKKFLESDEFVLILERIVHAICITNDVSLNV